VFSVPVGGLCLACLFHERMNPMINRAKILTILTIALFLATSLVAQDAMAQGRRGQSSGAPTATAAPRPPIEISATYGSMWGGNIDIFKGKLRMATGPSASIAIDIPLHPAAMLELSYTGQNGGLDHDWQGQKVRLTDMSVNYWHIGAIKGLLAGPVRPWVSTSIGATHYGVKESEITIDDETFRVESMTKFSFIIGAGVKAYFGKAEKVGLRASIKVLPTLYNTGAGLWVGGGGASVGVTGNAIWQWEAAIGLTVKLGG